MCPNQVSQDAQRAYERVTYKVTKDDLESMGERTVIGELNSGKYGSSGHKVHTFVSSWLDEKRFLRDEEEIFIAKAANTIALAAATLDSEANAIARRDKKHSFIETIISIAIAIKTAIWR